MKFLLWIYNFLFPFVLLILLPGAIWRMVRRGNYAHMFGQRLGWYSRRTRAVLQHNRGRWVWIHAVSVGEVQIALKFIHVLRRESGLPVLLSTTTSTGFSVANQHRSAGFEIIYHPVDFFWIARRAIELVRPVALILVEAEIWPNLVWQARRCGARVMVLNARLSERSERRFRAVLPLARWLFQMPEVLCLQSEEDVERYCGLGAVRSAIRVTGSVKFDLDADFSEIHSESQKKLIEELGWSKDNVVFLGASTHAGEEVLLAKVFDRLRRDFENLRLILVPRHAERAGEVLREVAAVGLLPVLRNASERKEAEVLVVNTTGELKNWIQLSDIVFVGKSLTAHGGQNPAEAIALGKPVIFGPNMENFEGLKRMILAKDGARVVRNELELETTLRQFLTHPSAAEEMARRALAALAPHRGATMRSVRELLQLLEASQQK